MRVLVIGGSGFVGSTLVARLIADGHDVTTLSRGVGQQGAARQVQLDVSGALSPESWFSALTGVDAVVNCAGALQDSGGQSTHGVHVEGPAALYLACERLGIRRIVQLSAVGVDRETPTAFSRSKKEGDEILMRSNLDWVVLRPAVIIGRPAYGGSALIRGLASLPIMPVLPGTGQIQLVHLDDVIATILFFIRPDAPSKKIVELVGPRRWDFAEAVRMFRGWLRWAPAAHLRVPQAVASTLYRIGDAVNRLGWRTPVTSTAQAEMRRGATGDPSTWTELTGLAPRDVETTLRREPASVQERWFAQLYVLKPILFGVFGLFWIATGIISFGPGWEIGMSLMREGGVNEPFASLAIISGASADILIGCAILYRPTSRYGLYAALVISVAYAVIGTILVPRLWSDPLGPMLKIWPIMVLNMVALAIREDR